MNILRKIETVLDSACTDLKLLKDNYFIIGSSALILSGIPIENTHDIDIITSKRDATLLKGIWKERLLEDHSGEDDHLFHSNFSRYRFGELDIEVMGNLKVKSRGVWQILDIREYQIVSLNNFDFKIPTLREQKRIFKLFGREKDYEKLKLIEKYEQ